MTRRDFGERKKEDKFLDAKMLTNFQKGSRLK